VSTFFCDTTVLFAASDAGHVHHARSLALVTKATPARAFVAAHSLAELYATLSSAPAPRMRRVDHVLEAVEHVAEAFSPVTLGLDDYLWVLRRAAATGSRSGRVYDCLILKCAERAKVDDVYTWNVGHFTSVAWPEMAAKIRTP
jgi:predicted nucleic acid-binding protein